jgi:hypothetical protein
MLFSEHDWAVVYFVDDETRQDLVADTSFHSRVG